MDESSKEPLVKTMWHELYLECQANPLDNRTDVEFVAENKLSPATLSVWKRNNRQRIFDEVQKRRGQYVNQMRAIGYKHLNRMATKDINAVKLLFQLTGDLVEKSQTTIEHMTREDRIARINSILGDAQEKVKMWDKIKKTDSTEKPDNG